MPDGRIVNCDLPPKNSNRVGRCADGELIVWNDRDQSYYVTGPQQSGPSWGQIAVPSGGLPIGMGGMMMLGF